MKPLPETPLVSIVTPSFNTGRFIEETLRSVSEQDYPFVEHIVLDSGSTDETLAILARFPSVRLITTGPCGLSEKVKHGFSIARGDIIGWLCADDYYLPGAIAKAVDALKGNPDAALVYCNIIEVDEHSVEIERRDSRQVGFRELLDTPAYVGPIFFTRREALEHVGSLDTRYQFVVDWDLTIRISRMFPILYIDDWWTAFRIREGQLTHVHKYASWLEGRKMSREHGARFFSPVFWTFWRGKFSRAGLLLLRGQIKVFSSKLRDFLVDYAWRHAYNKIRPHKSQGRPPAQSSERHRQHAGDAPTSTRR